MFDELFSAPGRVAAFALAGRLASRERSGTAVDLRPLAGVAPDVVGTLAQVEPPASTVPRRAATRWRRRAAAALLALGAATAAWAQPDAAPGDEPATAAAAASDPYGRETPRSLATGLVSAFAAGSFDRAANYLEDTGVGAGDRARPAAGGATARAAVARRLQQQLDRGGSLLPFSALSNTPAGTVDDGLPLDEEVIGSFTSTAGAIDLVARRVAVDGLPPHWVVSARSLAAIAGREAVVGDGALDAVLPRALTGTRVAGAPLADWLVLLVAAVVAFFAMRLLFALLLKALRALLGADESHRGLRFASAASPPLGLYLAVIAVFTATQQLQLSIVARQVVGRYLAIVGWIAFVWFLWRLIDVVGELWAARMARTDRRRAMSALVFVRRSAKTLLGIVAVVAVLDTVGIDVTTGIAALGIGGLAIALGAQKTVENLVGSLTVIVDQPVRVGDFCKVGDVVGTVEDIGMRSTRVRTNARTVVTIPNGHFSSQQIENFSRRDRFLFDPVIGVTHDVDAARMRELLAAVRAVLDGDEHVIDGGRARFVGFGASSLDIEIFAYIRTHDYAEFLGLREAIYLKLMDAIDGVGASIAFPTQTLMLHDTSGFRRPAAGADALLPKAAR